MSRYPDLHRSPAPGAADAFEEEETAGCANSGEGVFADGSGASV